MSKKRFACNDWYTQLVTYKNAVFRENAGIDDLLRMATREDIVKAVTYGCNREQLHSIHQFLRNASNNIVIIQ